MKYVLIQYIGDSRGRWCARLGDSLGRLWFGGEAGGLPFVVADFNTGRIRVSSVSGCHGRYLSPKTLEFLRGVFHVS